VIAIAVKKRIEEAGRIHGDNAESILEPETLSLGNNYIYYMEHTPSHSETEDDCLDIIITAEKNRIDSPWNVTGMYPAPKSNSEPAIIIGNNGRIAGIADDTKTADNPIIAINVGNRYTSRTHAKIYHDGSAMFLESLGRNGILYFQKGDPELFELLHHEKKDHGRREMHYGDMFYLAGEPKISFVYMKRSTMNPAVCRIKNIKCRQLESRVNEFLR
jgi:hypothetical protein